MFVKENPDRKKSFIFLVNSEDIYEDLAGDVMWLMKNEMSRKIMEESEALILKMYSYLMDLLTRKQRAQSAFSNRK